MGFHPANFGLPRPFRSRVRSRHATDRRTNGQTDTAHHFIMPLPTEIGDINVHINTEIQGKQEDKNTAKLEGSNPRRIAVVSQMPKP